MLSSPIKESGTKGNLGILCALLRGLPLRSPSVASDDGDDTIFALVSDVVVAICDFPSIVVVMTEPLGASNEAIGARGVLEYWVDLRFKIFMSLSTFSALDSE